jgi:hypothetical protein
MESIKYTMEDYKKMVVKEQKYMAKLFSKPDLAQE